MRRLHQPSTAVGTTRTKVRIGQEPARLGYAATTPAPSASDLDFIRLPCIFLQCDFCHQTLEPAAPIFRVARWDLVAVCVGSMRLVLRNQTSSRRPVDERPSMANPSAVLAVRASSHYHRSTSPSTLDCRAGTLCDQRGLGVTL